MAKNKTLMYVGIASAVLITGGLIWWFTSRNKNKGTENKDQEKPPASDTGTTPASDTGTTPASDTGTPPATTPATPPAPQQESLPSTPFQNKNEGNLFRVWVNKNYPNFSYQGEKLDTTGDYNNKYIRKAWQMYGEQYIKATAPLVSQLKSGDKLYIPVSKSVVNLYSFPSLEQNAGGQGYRYGYKGVSRSEFLDNPYARFTETAGNNWTKVVFYPSWVKKDNSIGWYAKAAKTNLNGIVAYVQNSDLATTPF